MIVCWSYNAECVVVVEKEAGIWDIFALNSVSLQKTAGVTFGTSIQPLSVSSRPGLSWLKITFLTLSNKLVFDGFRRGVRPRNTHKLNLKMGQKTEQERAQGTKNWQLVLLGGVISLFEYTRAADSSVHVTQFR